jgi:hypothetical protein
MLGAAMFHEHRDQSPIASTGVIVMLPDARYPGFDATGVFTDGQDEPDPGSRS